MSFVAKLTANSHFAQHLEFRSNKKNPELSIGIFSLIRLLLFLVMQQEELHPLREIPVLLGLFRQDQL